MFVERKVDALLLLARGGYVRQVVVPCDDVSLDLLHAEDEIRAHYLLEDRLRHHKFHRFCIAASGNKRTQQTITYDTGTYSILLLLLAEAPILFAHNSDGDGGGEGG